VVFTSPAANQPNLYGESGDFAFPADGAYVITITNNVTTAVAGDMGFGVHLLWRWVDA